MSACVSLEMLTAHGAVVEWQPTSSRILMRYRDVQVVMSPGVAAADVNGVASPMEMAPWVDDGQPYVPLRFLAEALALTVTWEPETRTVTVVT